jgi:hypothetical protein
MFKKKKPTTKTSGSTAQQREVQDTRKRNNILIHQAHSAKEIAGWVGVLDVQW